MQSGATHRGLSVLGDADGTSRPTSRAIRRCSILTKWRTDVTKVKENGAKQRPCERDMRRQATRLMRAYGHVTWSRNAWFHTYQSDAPTTQNTRLTFSICPRPWSSLKYSRTRYHADINTRSKFPGNLIKHRLWWNRSQKRKHNPSTSVESVRIYHPSSSFFPPSRNVGG